MIFGHEGLPRSGKSYEAVLHHILHALRAKRHVYVRLNGVGEKLDKIALHLSIPGDEVRSLVHVMGDKEVVDWCVFDTDNDGGVSFPHIEKHALVVIDEAHEYWPTNRANLPERAANFFAKHGHISLDMVIISQDCKDLHRLIIRRMAKKNTYTKLDALGSDQRYSVRFYAATGTVSTKPSAPRPGSTILRFGTSITACSPALNRMRSTWALRARFGARSVAPRS